MLNGKTLNANRQRFGANFGKRNVPTAGKVEAGSITHQISQKKVEIFLVIIFHYHSASSRGYLLIGGSRGEGERHYGAMAPHWRIQRGHGSCPTKALKVLFDPPPPTKVFNNENIIIYFLFLFWKILNIKWPKSEENL